jgi:hypothetical protein
VVPDAVAEYGEQHNKRQGGQAVLPSGPPLMNRAFACAGHHDLALEEGSCRQVPGSGISGVVQGSRVAVGSADFVCSQLGAGEQGAADRFMEASTSQTSDSMQVGAPKSCGDDHQ